MSDRERYLEVLEKLGGAKGDWRKGEIEIITDPDLMTQAAQKVGQEIGVVDEDPYVIHLRDAVWFPPKPGETEPVLGAYIRFVYTYELRKNLGVFVLPVHTDGRIVFNLTFRHALRGWTMEGSGTIGKEGESVMKSVERCMKDELGCEVKSLHELTDKFVPERGLLGGLVPIYLARVDFQHKEVDDPTVRGHVLLTYEEFWDVIRNGGAYEHKGVEHYCCDGYTIAAVQLAELKGFI